MSKKILVVDDEPVLVKAISLRLKAAKFDVVTSCNGEDALKMATEDRPDLIILDVMMPAPNGFEVCRTLKNDSGMKSIPIILLTAKATDSDKFWGSESGADAYITKPYDHERLIVKVRELLGPAV